MGSPNPTATPSLQVPPPQRILINPRAFDPSRKNLAVVTIVLTFDDGPHAASGDASNHTRQVLSILAKNSVQPQLKAAFFVQTDVAHRMGSAVGRLVVRDIHAQGHLIAIHTGSTSDHEKHWKRVAEPAEDIDGDRKPDGDNGLETDMIRAKQHILSAIGQTPKYVRAVGGELASPWSIFGRGKVVQVYDKFNLKHIRWDVDSHDNQPPRPGPEKVVENLMHGVEEALASGKTELVVLFHDINETTAANLDKYIKALAGAVIDKDREFVFAKSREEIDAVFSKRHDGN